MILAVLLHLMVFVYWLGGDLGAFYASFLVSDARQPPAARLAAAQVLSRVDLAPNVALILALPTGLTLALTRGWLDFPSIWLAPIWIGAAAWAALSWRLHLARRKGQGVAGRVDTAIRFALIVATAFAGIGGLAGAVALPLFIALKLLVLAGATCLGLLLRRLMRPFGPAFAALREGRHDVRDDAAIAVSLGRARVVVLGIWLLVLCAAVLGLAHPVAWPRG